MPRSSACADIEEGDAKAIQMASRPICTVVVSHRSGETGDTIIERILVAPNAGQIKIDASAKNNCLECGENFGKER